MSINYGCLPRYPNPNTAVPVRYYLAIVPGRSPDYSALAVVSGLEARRGQQATAFRNVHVTEVERLPLGTGHATLAGRVREVIRDDELRGRCVVVTPAVCAAPHLVRHTDYPFLNMLRDMRLACDVSVVSIPGVETEHQSGAPWCEAQRRLVARLQLAWEREELVIPGNMGPMGARLEQLIETGEAGNYDDRLFALALAWWRAQRPSGTATVESFSRQGRQRPPGKVLV